MLKKDFSKLLDLREKNYNEFSEYLISKEKYYFIFDVSIRPGNLKIIVIKIFLKGNHCELFKIEFSIDGNFLSIETYQKKWDSLDDYINILKNLDNHIEELCICNF
jgi:hypothetical protein